MVYRPIIGNTRPSREVALRFLSVLILVVFCVELLIWTPVMLATKHFMAKDIPEHFVNAYLMMAWALLLFLTRRFSIQQPSPYWLVGAFGTVVFLALLHPYGLVLLLLHRDPVTV